MRRPSRQKRLLQRQQKPLTYQVQTARPKSKMTMTCPVCGCSPSTPISPRHGFLVDEVLLGEDKTVVGVTSQITGTISVDPADPASAQIGTIIIDARDLTTDSSRRNRSIQRQVLRSVLDENRFITFEPTAIDGLPATMVIGEPFSFTVTGDLTVVGESRTETFDLTVTANSPTEVSGTATTVVHYDEYGISIPSVPAVARVDEEVRLELAFVASAAE
jgi:polyisoprenoid-binding protein YceI